MIDLEAGMLARSTYGARTKAGEQAAPRGQELAVEILDLNPGRRLPEEALPAVREFRPDVIGLSALSCESDSVHALSHLLKREMPAVPVVLGGEHWRPAGDRRPGAPCGDARSKG